MNNPIQTELNTEDTKGRKKETDTNMSGKKRKILNKLKKRKKKERKKERKNNG